MEISILYTMCLFRAYSIHFRNLWLPKSIDRSEQESTQDGFSLINFFASVSLSNKAPQICNTLSHHLGWYIFFRDTQPVKRIFTLQKTISQNHVINKLPPRKKTSVFKALSQLLHTKQFIFATGKWWDITRLDLSY